MPATAKIGEIPTAFVAFFGMPAVFGLTLGQFIADLGLESSPLVMITPAVSFLGLLGYIMLEELARWPAVSPTLR